MGMVTYSTSARVEFSLDTHQDLASLQHALMGISFHGGWTATAWGLYFARVMLDPYSGFGARPDSEGAPKIAILLTDGRSNLVPIARHAADLREKVQVKLAT